MLPCTSPSPHLFVEATFRFLTLSRPYLSRLLMNHHYSAANASLLHSVKKLQLSSIKEKSPRFKSFEELLEFQFWKICAKTKVLSAIFRQVIRLEIIFAIIIIMVYCSEIQLQVRYSFINYTNQQVTYQLVTKNCKHIYM